MDYLSKSFRLDEQVIEAIETAKAGGTSPNKFLRALLGFDDGPEVRPTISRVQPARVYSDPREIPGVSVGPPAKKPEGAFRCRCVHSGCQGQYFQGTSKFQTLCDLCRELKHSGDPRNCQICYEDTGPA